MFHMCIVCVCVSVCVLVYQCMCLCVSAYMHTFLAYTYVYLMPPCLPLLLHFMHLCHVPLTHHVRSICFFPITHILSVLPLSVSIRHCLASLSLDMEVAIVYWAWYESVHGFRLFFSVWIMSLYHHFTQLGYLRGWSLMCWVLLCVISSAAACPLSCFSIAAAGVCAYVMLVWIRNDDLCMQHESVCAGLCSAIEAHPAHLSHTVLYTQSVCLHSLCVHVTNRTMGKGYLGKVPSS